MTRKNARERPERLLRIKDLLEAEPPIRARRKMVLCKELPCRMESVRKNWHAFVAKHGEMLG